MIYKGGCHCGRTTFEVEGDLQQVIECNCSLCSKRGYLLWFAPRAALRFATPEENLSTYTFNTEKIKHRFCPTCGCAPFGLGTSPDGTEMAAINVRCLDGVDVKSLQTIPVDGRSR